MARILCIEDDEQIQHLVGTMLFRHGYDMHYAWSGREGYEKCLSLKPDLVLLDLMLPVMNGIELLQKLRANGAARDIPVIVVTAFSDEASMLQYAVEALGAEHYIRKPIDFKELLSAIKCVLARAPCKPENGGSADLQEFRKGNLRADPVSMTVWLDGRLLGALPCKEFALLRCLMKAPGSLSKTELLRGLGYSPGQEDALRQVAHRLRRALGPSESRRLRATADGYEMLG